MRTLLLNIVVFFFLLSCVSNHKDSTNQKVYFKNELRDSMFIVAKKDLLKNSLKYYYYGISSVPKSLSDTLKQTFGITVINNIEIPSKQYSFYNEFTDSILLKKSGKLFKDFYTEN